MSGPRQPVTDLDETYARALIATAVRITRRHFGFHVRNFHNDNAPAFGGAA